MDKNKYVSASSIRNAIDISKEKVMGNVDQDARLKEIYKYIEKKNKLSKPVRKKVHYLTKVIMTTACALLLSFLATAAIMDNIDPITQNTNPSTRSSGQPDKEHNKQEPEKETKTIVTETEVQVSPDRTNIKTGTIQLSGGNKHLNPKKIILKGANIKNGNCEWNIKKYRTENVVHKGKGTIVNKGLKDLVSSKKDMNYLITYTYKDKNDNKIQVYEVFTMTTEANST